MRGVVSAWREPDAPDEVGAVGGFQLVIRRGERTPANRGRLVLPRRVPLWVEEPRLVALVHDHELVHGRECVRHLGGPGSELSDSRAVPAGLRISRRLAPVPVRERLRMERVEVELGCDPVFLRRRDRNGELGPPQDLERLALVPRQGERVEPQPFVAHHRIDPVAKRALAAVVVDADRETAPRQRDRGLPGRLPACAGICPGRRRACQRDTRSNSHDRSKKDPHARPFVFRRCQSSTTDGGLLPSQIAAPTPRPSGPLHGVGGPPVPDPSALPVEQT